jgi:hypothetical protein
LHVGKSASTTIASLRSRPFLERDGQFSPEFNFEHPLLTLEIQYDDDPRPSPVETLLRELSREIAIQEANAPSTPIDARVSVKTIFGALPDLDRELRFDLSDPEVEERELEGTTPRANALTALLSEFVLGPARIVRDYLARMIYVGPLREIPARDYIPQFSPDESRWARGLAAWDLLHGPRGRELIDEVNFWLFDKERLNSGYRLERIDYRRIPSPSPIDVIFQRGVRDEDLPDLQELYEQYPVDQEVGLRDTRTGTLVGPSDVGVGLSQLVPVIVSLVSGDDGLVAIEQPELHTPQPGMTPDKPGARRLYKALRTAFPDFHAVIHWQTADGEVVTTFKTYHGTHQGTFLGVAPTGRKIHFEAVDAMRVHEGKITEHWGAANLFSLMQQLGALPSAAQAGAAALSRRRRSVARRLPDLPRCSRAGFRARNGDEFCQPED